MNVRKFGKDNYETCDFDKAVSLTGYGKFHLEITTACCLSILVVGCQNGISSYIFPPARCELKLTSFELGLLNVAFLGGGTFGCFVWGLLADNHGRRKILVLSHLLNTLVTVVASFNPFNITLLICRFLNGFFIGAPGSLVYTYIAEFHSSKYKFRSVCALGLSFILSWLLLPIMAYLILPISIHYNFKNILVISSWRFFLLLVAVPELIAGLWFIRLPESPKYYVAKGCSKEALVILQRMYAVNHRTIPDFFPVKNILCEANFDARKTEIMVGGKTARILKDVIQQIKKMFQRPLLRRSVLTSLIMFSNMFGLFGLGLWLPEFFIKVDKFSTLHPNDTITLKQLSYLPVENENSCQPSFEQSVIISTVATAITALIFNGISCLIATKVSSKTTSLVLSLIGGISAGSIYFLTSSLQHLIVACIFQATILTANMSITSIVVELFPTDVGGVAVCLVVCAGRIGAAVSNLVFAYFMDKHCEIPIFVVALVELVGAMLCILLPKTNKLPNKDKEEDIRKSSSGITTISDKIVGNDEDY